MFNRVPVIRYTCSSCRLRLSQVRQSEYPLLQRSNSCQRRQQSAVALRVDESIEDFKSTDGSGANLQEQRSISIPQKEEPTTGHGIPQRTQKNYRRWRPHPAENLGVNVLGRPAEVLILPNRKRKVAQIVPSGDGDGDQPGLQSSLDSESKPISMKEVLKNIDSLKEELGHNKQEFSMTEWKESRRRLADGFTKTQLEAYLYAAGNEKNAGLQDTPSSTRGNSKHKIATLIMVEVWKWKNTDMNESATDSLPDTIPQPMTKNVHVNAAKLGYIMLHEKRMLGRLSETLGVQIDVFKKKQKIRLTGMAQTLDSASLQLRQLINGIREQTVEIPARLQKPLEDRSKSMPVFSMLMHKHKLFITKEKDQLSVVSHSKLGADMVVRDLMFMSGILRRGAPSTFYVEHTDEGVAQVPFHSEELLSNPLQKDAWFRYTSNQSTEQMSDEKVLAGTRKLRSLTEKLLKTATYDQSKLSRYVVKPGSLVHEYTTSLAQALFAQECAKSTTDASSLHDSAKMSSAVVLQQALLPQVLDKGDFTQVGSKNSGGGADESMQPLLLRIRLQPAEGNENYPPLEILLSGQDASLGLRQKLVVRRAFAIIDQWQHNILLPNKSLDIIMSRRSKIDLLGEPESLLPKKDLMILRQLGSYLEQAQNVNQHQLPPIWRIDVSTLLKTPNPPRDGESTGLTLTSSTSQDTNANDQSISRDSATKDSTAMYLLEPPEILDFTSFSSQQTSNERYIDHIVCHTESSDPPRQRQILRIRASPLYKVIEEAPSNERARKSGAKEWNKWLGHSVTTAYQIAAMLNGAEKSAGRSFGATQLPETV